MNKRQKRTMIKIILSIILYAVVKLLPVDGIYDFAAFFLVYIIIGGDVLLKAARNIIRGSIFDENFLMSVATLGAFAIGEYSEGVFVMLFYQIGELMQSYAVGKSRKSISALMDIRPDYANILKDGKLFRVSPEDVKIGDEIIVRPGEKVPLDGEVVSGTTTVDTSPITGESIPKSIGVCDHIISGCVNLTGRVTVKVTQVYGESTVSKILDLVENASLKKATAEKFITKFSKYYTPAVVIAALCVAIILPVITGEAFSVWFRNALIFLVVSCPCALVISVPLAFFCGIGRASASGILIKGSNYFEFLANAKIAVFDKTGTLTKGKFEIKKIFPADGFEEEYVLRIAAIAEKYTLHPIGKSITAAFKGEISEADEINEVPGGGIVANFEGKAIVVGNHRFMCEKGISLPEVQNPFNTVYVSFDGIYIGRIVVGDEIKVQSASAIGLLKSEGVKKTIILTGDTESNAEAIGDALAVDEVYSCLLPYEKVSKMEEIISSNTSGNVIYVGDGVNDAPVLARADVGIAMGAYGSAAAIEAADAVIMDDNPENVSKAIKIAKKTLAIARENIIFALGVKVIVLILGVLGLARMWEAVFADVGVSVLAILNSLRILKKSL